MIGAGSVWLRFYADDPDSFGNSLVIWCACVFASLFALFLYPLLTRADRTVRLTRPTWKRVLVEAGIAAIATVPLYFFCIAFSVVAARLAPDSPTGGESLQQWSQSTFNWASYAYLAAGILVGPIAEEVFHRGFLYNALRKRFHVSLAIVLQALVFGLSHPYPVLGVVNIFLIGLILAAFYHWRKSILAPALLHMYLNAALFAFALTSAQPLENPAVIGVVPDTTHDQCRVATCVENGPAWDGGIRAGDIITGLGEYRILDATDFYNAMWNYAADETVPVWFERDGEDLYTEVKPISRTDLSGLLQKTNPP